MKHILFLGIGVIAACTQHSVTTNNSKAGPTQVFLIDAPFPYDQVARVDVYIVRVAAGTSADTTDGAPGVIAAPHRAYNLLALGNGAAAKLGEGILLSGQYVQFLITMDADSSSAIIVVNPNYQNDEATWGVLGTARSDSTGLFRLPYASPGSYVLAVDAPATSVYGGLRLPNVSVSTGVETQTGTLIVPHK